MQGSKSVVRLNSGGPLEVNNTIQRATDSQTGIFTVLRCITYTRGKRVLTITITEMGCAGRVNVVDLSLSEQNGKGSCANLDLRFIRDERYGVLYNLNSELAGSYGSIKNNYCVPPLPDTELIGYVCRETGFGSWLTITKKKDEMGSVEKVKVTHAFLIDADESTYNVSIKMTNIKRVGLNVEVEAPVKMTMDYSKQFISTITGKMDSQMEASLHSLFKNSMRQLPKNATNKEIDNHDDGRTSYKLTVWSNDSS